MAQRKALKNVAGGLVGSFVSRNNDTNGYWALGLLYSLVNTVGTKRIRITLRPSPDLDPDPLLADVASRYSAMLERLLRASGVATESVSEARTDVHFDIADPTPSLLSGFSRGQPVSCEASLIDNNGKAHSQECITICAPHDANRESRSGRASGI